AARWTRCSCAPARAACARAPPSPPPPPRTPRAGSPRGRSPEVHAPALRRLATNGITLEVWEQGEGPLVLLLHGFPEGARSFRHQLPALAAAGFRAVAPDLRGYGGSDAPEAVAAYDQVTLAADAAGLIEALGERHAVVV